MKLFSQQAYHQSSPIRVLVFLTFSFMLSTTYADTTILHSGQEISSETFGSVDAEYAVLWLHSERGIVPNLQKTLKAIATEKSVKVILPDFHESYFIPVTRSSLDKIPQKDIENYITRVAKDIAPKKLFVFAMSRFAGNLLKATYNLQLEEKNPIAGIVLLAPYLQTQTPEIGKKAQFLTVTSMSNLPLYLIQAERSPRYVPLPNLVKELEKGGSPLFVHVLKDVHGGFQQRDVADLREKDIQALKDFPNTVYNALMLLDDTNPAPFKATSALTNTAIKKKSHNGLQPIVMATPALKMNDLNSRLHDLSAYKGKTVIVSFWASWCRPCLDEMPSLVKLKATYKDNLEILGVNIREDKAIIQHFTKNMDINFPLLQDKDSAAVKDWNVYVYPSNFIVDKTGKLRYAATGAMDWQDKEIVGILELMIQDK